MARTVNAKVKIRVRKEIKLDKDFNEVSEAVNAVYIACDGAEAWIGTANNREELLSLIAPDEILDLLNVTLSQDELDIFCPVMCSGDKYYCFDEEFIVE